VWKIVCVQDLNRMAVLILDENIWFFLDHLVITRLRYVYLSTVGRTISNCSRSPVRRIIFAACTASDVLT